FGAKADTAPYFNLPSIAFNSLDRDHGVMQAFFDAGLGNHQHWITNGFAVMDDMLNADLHTFFQTPLGNTLGPTLEACRKELELYRNQGQGTFQTELPIVLAKYFDPTTGALIDKMRHMDVDGGGVCYSLSNSLDSVIAAIDSVQFIIMKQGTNRPTGGKLVGAVLYNTHPKLKNLVTNKLGKPVGKGLDKFSEVFNTYLKDYDSSLDQISDQLLELRNQVVHVRTNLDAGGEFQQELRDLYVSH